MAGMATRATAGSTRGGSADSAHHQQAVRLRETPEVSWAYGLPMMLPSSGAPRFFAFPNYHTKQLMLFDLLADDAVGIPVAQIEFALFTAAVSANGDSLCLGDSRGGLWVFDQADLVASALARLNRRQMPLFRADFRGGLELCHPDGQL